MWTAKYSSNSSSSGSSIVLLFFWGCYVRVVDILFLAGEKKKGICIFRHNMYPHAIATDGQIEKAWVIVYR